MPCRSSSLTEWWFAWGEYSFSKQLKMDKGEFCIGAIIASILFVVNRESLKGLRFKSGASDIETWISSFQGCFCV